MDHPKLFVVSPNKAATSSMKFWMERHGFRVAPQQKMEPLGFEYLLSNNRSEKLPQVMSRLGEESRVFDGFQDIPFSIPDFLGPLLERFATAKFVYVSREFSGWYRSLVTHHIRRRLGITPVFNEEGCFVPSDQVLQGLSADLYRGVSNLELVTAMFGTPQDNPYDRPSLLAWLNEHQQNARRVLTDANHLIIGADSLSSINVREELERLVGRPVASVEKCNVGFTHREKPSRKPNHP